jgi:uncharacterized protein (TIGR03437 family)
MGAKAWQHETPISVTGALARTFTLYIDMKIRGRSLVVCLGLLCLSAARGQQQYTIQTLAGNGSAGFAGDSGAPAAAQLNFPQAVALDSKGNLYIADTANQRIRMISVAGIITTVAGTGTLGYSGDKSAATAATFSSPSGLGLDSKDNLYIADTGNNVIRKITGTTITTVAGIGGQGPGYGGDLGPATSANLSGPTAVALDSQGNLFIADNGNSLIRKVDTTGFINSYLGSGATNQRLTAPNGLWFDASGALYIADSGNQRVARYAAPTLSHFARNLTPGFSGDGGQADRAQLNKPSGIAIDAAGSVYVADTNNSRIRKITADGTISTIAGKGGGAYSGDGGDATSAALNFPRSIAVSSNGTVYIADTNNHVIRVLTPSFPTISANGVTNAASFAARISPGALASVFGTGFGTGTFLADSGFAWPGSAIGIVVKVNGVAAPLYFVSPGQINFQVPWATPTTGTVNVAVLVNGGSSNIAAVPVATAAPGLFSLASGAAIVQNAPAFTLNDASNPAPAGSTIIAYLTGSGPVTPAAKDGVPAPTDSLTTATSAVAANIGSTAAAVSFTGFAPGFIGLVQMNIVVPATLPAGVYPLSITIDGQTANSATIAVK